MSASEAAATATEAVAANRRLWDRWTQISRACSFYEIRPVALVFDDGDVAPPA